LSIGFAKVFEKFFRPCGRPPEGVVRLSHHQEREESNEHCHFDRMPNQLRFADVSSAQILEDADCDARTSEHTENDEDYS
jgi:hypothetical protein